MSFPTAPSPATTIEHAAVIGATVPQDRATANIINVTFRGHALTIDTDSWTLEVNEHFENNMIAKGVRALFGDGQWERVLRHLPMKEFGELMQAVKDAGPTAGK